MDGLDSLPSLPPSLTHSLPPSSSLPHSIDTAGIFKDLYATSPVTVKGLPVILYNLKNDPYENQNVAFTHQLVVKRLLNLLTDKYVPSVVTPVVPPFCCSPQTQQYRAAAADCVSPWLLDSF